jgi:microcystin-dependent protein
MTPFIGQLMAVGFDFAPTGWALCNGQILQISQYQALFSLLGTFYGGDGVRTFALPDLQGRVPLSAGPGYAIGHAGGEASHLLTQAEVPPHTHSFMASTAAASGPSGQNSPINNALGQNAMYANVAPNTPMAQNAVSSVGGTPHENRQPFTVINWVIALQGLFPSRS